MSEELERIDPKVPEDFKMILLQLGKVIEIYHELFMAYAHPSLIVKSKASVPGSSSNKHHPADIVTGV